MPGCCADRACTPKTCMALLSGVTCGACLNFRRCVALIDADAEDNACDWFPRRFRAATPTSGGEDTKP